MARLSNQIDCICTFLSNFQPALVLEFSLWRVDGSQNRYLKLYHSLHVDKYFQGLSDTEDEQTSESDDEL